MTRVFEPTLAQVPDDLRDTRPAVVVLVAAVIHRRRRA
jgi:hypothetical protein